MDIEETKLNNTENITDPIEIIIHVMDFQCDVEIVNKSDDEDDEMEHGDIKFKDDEDDEDKPVNIFEIRDHIKKLKSTVKQLCQNIWIDKTYVCFKGNRWRDAFIVEQGWKDLISILKETGFGKTEDEDDKILISQSIGAIVITYLYSTMEKLGYDPSEFVLHYKGVFSAEYFLDKRTEWLM